MLQEFLKVIGSKVDREKEAEAMEHYLSRETVDAMAMVVGFLMKIPDYRTNYMNFNRNIEKISRLWSNDQYYCIL